MDKARILESIDQYIKNPFTDYAVLINGEWGVGKTYFLKEEVYSLIKKSGLRPIYKSLIGLNQKVQLEKIILKEVNPFLSSKSRSPVSIEAEFIESIVNGGEKPISNFPKNIVLCFDDLERMNSDFFESAMGVINVFIEHHNTKCIFICNEQKIEKTFKNYKKIKEKYVRFTFEYNPPLEGIIRDMIEDLEEKYKDHYNISLILDVFKKGDTDNLRTLFFVLSVYQQILVEIEVLKLEIKHKTKILDLILIYICFYSIESKRGNSFMLLDKITIVNSEGVWSNFLGNDDINEVNDLDFDGEPVQTEVDDSSELAIIQDRYFKDSSLEFERFESVAELIKTGFLNGDLLKVDILVLDISFEENEIQERKGNVLKVIDNIFELSDAEIKEKIDFLINEVQEGFLDLPSYLKLYSNLVHLESFNVEGVEVSEKITEKFRSGARKAAESGRLKYVYNLIFQIQWNKDDKSVFAKKFRSFASYVDQLNDSIKDSNSIFDFEQLVKSIYNNDFDLNPDVLNSESNIRFLKEDAEKIYDALVKANAKTSNNFYHAIMERYNNVGTTISHYLSKESDFIISLYNLLTNDKILFIENPKPLSKVPLVFLKTYLKDLIEKYSIKLN